MTENLSEAISIFNGSTHYQQFLESLSSRKQIECNLAETALSEALYYHMWKIQVNAWQYIVTNKRSDRHPISEITQDLIAFYLKAALPDNYSVKLEAQGRYGTDKIHNLYVDICILKDGKPHFAIEVKTNLGYQRHAIEQINGEMTGFEIRRAQIAEAFTLHESKIIYVLLSVVNVNADFLNRYWNQSENSAIKIEGRKDTAHLNFIYPLFYNSDPYYYNYGKNFNRREKVIEFTDEQIIEAARNNIITPLEYIIELIKKDEAV